MLRRFSCATFALVLISCGSSQSTAAATVAVGPTHSLWQIGRDSSPPNWSRATDGDCGSITFPTDTSVKFAFSQGSSPSGENCLRDQMNPLSCPSCIFRLTDGVPYTFKIKAKINYTYSGNAQPVAPESLFWQTHVWGGPGVCGSSPGGPGLTVGDDHPGTFDFWNTNFSVHVGKFTKGVPFSLTVKELLQQQGDPTTGYAKLYQDGKLLYEYTGVNLEAPPCLPNPFWNFGPYSYFITDDKGVTTATSEGTFTEMDLTTP
jgi:hypothetical protein